LRKTIKHMTIALITGITGQDGSYLAEFLLLRDTKPMAATWADIKRAEQLRSWHPQVTFQEGVRSLLKGAQNNREWATEAESA